MEARGCAKPGRQRVLVLRSSFVLILLHSLEFCGMVREHWIESPGIFYSPDSAASSMPVDNCLVSVDIFITRENECTGLGD